MAEHQHPDGQIDSESISPSEGRILKDISKAAMARIVKDGRNTGVGTEAAEAGETLHINLVLAAPPESNSNEEIHLWYSESSFESLAEYGGSTKQVGLQSTVTSASTGLPFPLYALALDPRIENYADEDVNMFMKKPQMPTAYLNQGIVTAIQTWPVRQG